MQQAKPGKRSAAMSGATVVQRGEKTCSAPIPLFILVCNHFDLIWRRCYDRKSRVGGWTFASYSELEDAYIADNLALARRRRDYVFEIECTAPLRRYVQRHPERLPDLRRLAAQGRFGVRGGGDNIIDANLVHGESLVRNFTTGLWWLERHLGVRPGVAARNDAFGNSAQLPQILRGCGLRWVDGLSYSRLQGTYWRGLDGSVVASPAWPIAGSASLGGYYAPCAACRGEGCRTCRGRGLATQASLPFPPVLNDEQARQRGFGCLKIGSEEGLPHAGILAPIRDPRFAPRFARLEDLAPFLRDELDRVDDPPPVEVHPGVELNPNNSGVWVTRIATKQTVRRLEYGLLAAESLATLAGLTGAAYPRAALLEMWQDLLLTQFHDAITATVSDSAYAELQDLWKSIDRGLDRIRADAFKPLTRRTTGTISVFNPFSEAQTQVVTAQVTAREYPATLCAPDGQRVPVLAARHIRARAWEVDFVARDVPALGARTYRIRAGAKGRIRPVASTSIENERFRIDAGEHGPVCIFDKRLNRALSCAGAYLPGELVLESDFGSPWTTLSADRMRHRFHRIRRIEAMESGAGWQRLVWRQASGWNEGGRSRGVEAMTTMTLYDGIARVDCRTELDWTTWNSRLRVIFPLAARGRHWYGIPYGMLPRDPYTPAFGPWDAANGDWPGVNWAGSEMRGMSVAVLNRGLPSYGFEAEGRGENLTISLLRSPAIPSYLYRPLEQGPHDLDGMRDEGRHTLEYALTAYATPFINSRIVADADGYNGGLLTTTGALTLPVPPRVETPNVRLTALKQAEDGDGIVVRLVESGGRPARVRLAPPPGLHRVTRVDLLEQNPIPLTMDRQGVVTLPLHAWGIATVRMARE